MKRKRFTEEQIITVLREHEAGAKAGDLARKHGVSEATHYNLKAKYGGVDVSDAKRLKITKDWSPSSITTDKLASYPKAIRRLKREGKLAATTRHRTSKHLNNIIEADHGALKPMIRRVRGFKTMKTASATTKGFEIMRMIRRGHCILKDPGARGEVRFVDNLFKIAA